MIEQRLADRTELSDTTVQVVDVETGAIRWQNKAELTKGLIK
jgi:RecB family exonuclease